MIVSTSFPKASNHFVDANKMVKIGSNYGEFATFNPVDFDGIKPLENERFNTTATTCCAIALGTDHPPKSPAPTGRIMTARATL